MVMFNYKTEINAQKSIMYETKRNHALSTKSEIKMNINITFN